MAPHTYAKRLERLQQAYAAQINKPVASRFLAFDPNATAEDYEVRRPEELARMVEAGEIKSSQRQRVLFFRWMTAAENADRAQLQVDGPVPSPAKIPVDRHADGRPADPVPASQPSGGTEGERSARFNRPLDLPDLGIV